MHLLAHRHRKVVALLRCERRDVDSVLLPLPHLGLGQRRYRFLLRRWPLRRKEWLGWLRQQPGQ